VLVLFTQVNMFVMLLLVGIHTEPSSVGRAFDLFPKGRRFGSHRGQEKLSACPVWMPIQNNINNINLQYSSNLMSLL
jgi:hypothetical protein